MTKIILLIAFVALSGSAARGQGHHKSPFQMASHGKYRPGFYTLTNGTRHAGTLRIWQDLSRNVLQIEQGMNVEVAELQSFTMGADSFTVARQVGMAGKPAERPLGEVAVLRVLLQGKLQVFQHDQLVQVTSAPYIGAGGMMYGGGSSTQHVYTWVVRPAPGAALEAIPHNGEEFARQVAGLFVEYPALCQRIRAGLEGPDDFKRILYAFAFRKDISQVSYEQAATLFP